MERVGFRGVGWLVVLCGVSCASAPVATGGAVQKVTPVRPEAPAPVEPSLTPPPPRVLAGQVSIDFAPLVGGIIAGTSARFDLRAMSEVWPTATKLDRPIVMGIDGNGELIADDGQPRGRDLRDGHLVELQVSLAPSASSPVFDWRASAMRQLDALLPESSELARQPALRLGLTDLGFEIIDRVVDSYKRVGDLKVAIAPRQANGFAVSATIEPAAGSALGRAATSATNVRIPDAFWDLPAHTNRAVFFDAALLAPLWELSPRSRALLAEAGGAGGWSEQVLALPGACARPGRAWALAEVSQLEPEVGSAAPQAPVLPPLSDLKTSLYSTPPPSYALLGIEDPQGACGKALRSVLSAQERLAQVPNQSVDKRELSALPTEKSLPRGAQLFRLGTGEAATHFALAERKGVVWIGVTSELVTLKAALVDLLAPAPKRRGLRGRPELAALGKSTALASGFVREDAMPFAAWVTPPRMLEKSKRSTDPELRRITFALTKEPAALRLSGVLEARSLQQLFAKSIVQTLNFGELKKLAPEKLPSALGMLEAACQLGNGEACNILGVTYGDGRGVPKDAAAAIRWLEVGCALNDGKACANISFYKTVDKAQELTLLKKSCELDAAIGCAWWGIKLLESDEPTDQQLGLAKLGSACNGFVGFACARIGNHYWHGVGLPQDEEKSADYHERACELGFGSSCVSFSTALATGKGRKQDAASAFKYVQRACSLDKKEGCYALGLSYLYGQITPKNEDAARQQLQVACDAEHADACRVLAELSGEP